MSNSPLVEYTKLSPKCNSPRVYPITKITIHHMAGNLSIEKCGELFQTRQASSNYGIGSDGRVGMYVEEKDRSWCSSSYDNDHRAVTIEVANDGGEPNWHVSDKALAKCIDLCVDICQRNGIARLNFTGDASGNLTQHNYFTATACPGPYLKSKFNYIADEVNRRLSGSSGTLPQDTPTQVICGYASKGDLKAFAAAIADIGVAAIYPKDGYIATAIPISRGDQQKLVTLGSSLGVPVAPYEEEHTYGTPVARDIYAAQVEVLTDDLYCRTEPNLSKSTRLGFVTPGIYNVYETKDLRQDSNNGYFWYRIESNLWIPGGDWLKYYAPQERPSDEKDTEIKQLQAENEKLSQENEVLKGKVTALENSNKYLTARLAAYDADMAKIYEITSTYQT